MQGTEARDRTTLPIIVGLLALYRPRGRYIGFRRWAAVLLGAILLGGQALAAAEVSTLKPAEALVLMPTAAHRSADGLHWVVPVHAWVYVPQSSQLRRRAIAELLKLRYGLEVTPASASHFAARVNLLLADNKRGRTIVIDIAGTRATLPPTGANGHAHAEVAIPVSTSTPDGARLPIRAVLVPQDLRRIETSTHLIAPTGRSVISDIDDTVKITGVLDRRQMWEATFYKPFAVVAGMPEAYRRLAGKGAAFHYVSSSPWHLATPLLEFLAASSLPLSAISLKQIRLKDRTALDIFKPGRETKPPAIEAILTRFPQRKFILIGDTGEDDPEIYAEAIRRHPDQIERIYLRNISSARRNDARFAKTFAGIESARWNLFESPADIERP